MMDHRIEKLVKYISSVHTLRPGDVISTGTPGGVGSLLYHPLWMKEGDPIEIEIIGVGKLVNPIKNQSRNP